MDNVGKPFVCQATKETFDNGSVSNTLLPVIDLVWSNANRFSGFDHRMALVTKVIVSSLYCCVYTLSLRFDNVI